jgi:tetratricopeptide (TPR) repeat protein
MKQINNPLKTNELEKINQELKKNPGNQFLKISQARILIKMDELKKAKKIFIKMEDELLDEYLKFYYLAKAEYKLAITDEEKALKFLEKVLKLDPNLTDVLELKSELLHKNGHLKEILSDLKNVPAIHMTPKLSFYLGRAYYWNNEFNKAKKELEKSVADFPCRETYLVYAYLERREKNPDKQLVQAHLKKAFEINPKKIEAIRPQLERCFKNSDFKEALKFQELARDAVINGCMEYLEGDECDPEAFHALYEPDLLEADLVTCALYFINGKAKEAKSIINSPFWWEHDHEYFEILKDFVNSFISGDQARFNSSQIDLKGNIGAFYWDAISLTLDQKFTVLNRDKVFEELGI